MFEIGNALIQARHRLGLELPQVEQETKLRIHYLRALEQEQFDELPTGYRRSFLRSYATFLGLDADLLLEEYAARYETLEEAHSTEPLPRPVGGRPRRRPHWVTGVVIGALVLAGLAAALVLHDRGGSNAVPGGPAGPTVPLTGEGTTTVSTQTTTAAKPPSTNPKPKTIDVKLVAVTGRCWLLVRKGSALGPLVYEGTLEPGQSVSLHGIRYWARLGAPTALALSVNGAAQSLPTRTGNVVIDARGVTPTS